MRLIEALGLHPHPEGGWYRETWRGPQGADGAVAGRAIGTAIHFLLKTGQRSHWHRVDAHEIWLWHSGDPLSLSLATNDQGPVRTVTLGPAEAGYCVQHVVEAGEWQAAEVQAVEVQSGRAGYSLASCIVMPGFDFSGFELAPPDWSPGQELPR